MGIGSTYIISLGFSSFQVKSHWLQLTVLKDSIYKKLLELRLCVQAPEFETVSLISPTSWILETVLYWTCPRVLL